MDIQISQKTRDAVMSADIIVISTGANGLEDAFGLFAAGNNWGGADNFDCFRKVGEDWRTSFDGIQAEINTLRVGKPTAIQLVTNSNDALSDSGLMEIFGPKDSSGAGQRLLLGEAAIHTSYLDGIPTIQNCIDHLGRDYFFIAVVNCRAASLVSFINACAVSLSTALLKKNPCP